MYYKSMRTESSPGLCWDNPLRQQTHLSSKSPELLLLIGHDYRVPFQEFFVVSQHRII